MDSESKTAMDWDQHYQDKHTPWDKGAPAPPLLEWIAANPDALNGRILVPGCGGGHDVRALAATGIEDVLGFDISPAAIAEAKSHEAAGSEAYKAGDLFDLSEGMLDSFDWIWEHTCFCAIDPSMRDDYVKSAWEALRQNAQFLGVFYLNPYDDEHQPSGGPPHGTTEDELRQRFEGSGKFKIIESYQPQQSYSGREGLELVLRMRRLG